MITNFIPIISIKAVNIIKKTHKEMFSSNYSNYLYVEIEPFILSIFISIFIGIFLAYCINLSLKKCLHTAGGSIKKCGKRY